MLRWFLKLVAQSWNSKKKMDSGGGGGEWRYSRGVGRGAVARDIVIMGMNRDYGDCSRSSFAESCKKKNKNISKYRLN